MPAICQVVHVTCVPVMAYLLWKINRRVGNLYCFVMFILVFSITFENDNFWFDIKSKQAQLKTAGLLSWGGGGGGEISSRVHEQQSCLSRVMKQIVLIHWLLISATCSRDFCVAINFLGKPAIGGSERIEVWSYIKRLKSEVKSSYQMLVKVVWPN